MRYTVTSTLRRVLVELSVTEQRYRAVLQVQAGVPVSEVADAFGVSRQAVHRWLQGYRDEIMQNLDLDTRTSVATTSGRAELAFAARINSIACRAS